MAKLEAVKVLATLFLSPSCMNQTKNVSTRIFLPEKVLNEIISFAFFLCSLRGEKHSMKPISFGTEFLESFEGSSQ